MREFGRKKRKIYALFKYLFKKKEEEEEKEKKNCRKKLF